MIIFGHRGAPGFPRFGENTATSFRKAIECGANGLEFDVRRCGDGRLVVIHDDAIDRTTNGRGRVCDLSYDDIRKFDAGFGDPVPLLAGVLDEFGGKCLLNIELKESGIGPDVKRLIIERSIERGVLVSAFQWPELPVFAPGIPIGLLASRPGGLVAAARELGAATIHPRKDIVTSDLVKAAQDAGLRVYAWTVNEPAEMSRFVELGVDGIFTDFPERCSTFAS